MSIKHNGFPHRALTAALAAILGMAATAAFAKDQVIHAGHLLDAIDRSC